MSNLYSGNFWTRSHLWRPTFLITRLTVCISLSLSLPLSTRHINHQLAGHQMVALLHTIITRIGTITWATDRRLRPFMTYNHTFCLWPARYSSIKDFYWSNVYEEVTSFVLYHWWSWFIHSFNIISKKFFLWVKFYLRVILYWRINIFFIFISTHASAR